MTTSIMPVRGAAGSRQFRKRGVPMTPESPPLRLELAGGASAGPIVQDWDADWASAFCERQSEAIAGILGEANRLYQGSGLQSRVVEDVDPESEVPEVTLWLTLPSLGSAELLAFEEHLQEFLLSQFPEVESNVVVVCRRG